MRFKLFVVCALACGFMAYVLANENISTEVEDQIINAVPASKANKIVQAAEFVEIVDQPKKATPSSPSPAVAAAPDKKVQKAPAVTPKPLPTTSAGKLVPVVHVAPLAASSRGTDDILTVAGLKPQPKSGALVMPLEYLGELYDLDSTGYNWGKCWLAAIAADSVHITHTSR